MTCYIAAGTQSERAHVNNVIVMKMSNMSKNRSEPEEGDDSSDDDSDSDEDTPELETAMIKHVGAVNRIRVRFTQRSHRHRQGWGQFNSFNSNS